MTMPILLFALLASSVSPQENANVQLRGHLDHSRLRFEGEKKGHVAFMGGSITEMDGYRPMVRENLKKRFPATAFEFTDAGISSTCSTTGAFRLDRDVLSKGPVDLFFVEFAVNDDQDAGHTREVCIRGMEGIVRHVRRHNPRADIVITYFVNPGMLKVLQGGGTPLTIESHERVAVHYGVSSIHLAREVAGRIGKGALTWKEFGGTHPSKAGNRIPADMIETLFDRAWKTPVASEGGAAPHRTPDAIDRLNYEWGRFLEPDAGKGGADWTVGTPDWKALPGGKRKRFLAERLLVGEFGKGSKDLILEFEGTTLGVYVLAGPDAGQILAFVDGDKEGKRIDLYHRHSRGLHYPRTVILATDLKPGKHTVRLTVAGSRSGKGRAVRIMKFAVN